MRNHFRGIPRNIYNFRRNRPRNLHEQICNRREQVVRAGCKLLRANCQSKYQHCGGSLQSCEEKNIQFDCKEGTDNAAKRRAILLTSIGSGAYRVLKDLSFPAAPNTKTFDQLATLLRGHYKPTRLKVAERYSRARNNFRRVSRHDDRPSSF